MKVIFINMVLEIKYCIKPSDLKDNDLQNILDIHKGLVDQKWIKNYSAYSNIEDLRTNVINELGKSKDLIIAVVKTKIVGFVTLNKSDSKVSLIEVSENYIRKEGRANKHVGSELIKFLQGKYDYLHATIDSLKPEEVEKFFKKMGFHLITPKSKDLEWRK